MNLDTPTLYSRFKFEFWRENDGCTGEGNGFTFEAHAHSDFVQAMKRALAVYNVPMDYAALRAHTKKTVLDVEKVSLQRYFLLLLRFFVRFSRYCKRKDFGKIEFRNHIWNSSLKTS